MKRWEELGNDRWKLTITPDDPEDTETPPSVYRGTKNEIAEMLADSQSNANRRISELRTATKRTNGHAAGPTPLTAEQRLQTVAELNNPATVDKAITRIIESEMGETMEQRRAREQRENAEQEESKATETAMRFAADTPEWVQTPHNAETMVNYMRSQGMDLTNKSHYIMAFERLSAAKLLQTKALEVETETELEDEDERQRNAPVPVPVPRAPTRLSTGVTQRDISGLPPRPTTRLKYTREQIAELSAYDYKRLMLDDPQFTRCVEYYAEQDRQKSRRRVS